MLRVKKSVLSIGKHLLAIEKTVTVKANQNIFV